MEFYWDYWETAVMADDTRYPAAEFLKDTNADCVSVTGSRAPSIMLSKA